MITHCSNGYREFGLHRSGSRVSGRQLPPRVLAGKEFLSGLRGPGLHRGLAVGLLRLVSVSVRLGLELLLSACFGKWLAV